MKKRGEDVSDRRLITFLLLAIFISVISVWTVFLAVDFDVLSGQPQTQQIIIKQSPPASGVGVIGLTILPPGSEVNKTNETGGGP